MNQLDHWSLKVSEPMTTVPTSSKGKPREEWSCCHHIWTTASEAIVHIEENHPPESHGSGKLCLCPQCEEQFTKSGEVIAHFFWWHVLYQIKCSQCTLKFEYWEAFLNHINDCNQLVKEESVTPHENSKKRRQREVCNFTNEN